MNTRVKVRVTLDLAFEFVDRDPRRVPDDLVLRRVVGAELRHGGRLLATVELGEALVVEKRGEETRADRERAASIREFVRNSGGWPDEGTGGER